MNADDIVDAINNLDSTVRESNKLLKAIDSALDDVKLELFKISLKLKE